MTTRAFAPGRVNLIGEHTDYNDGFVLPMALSAGCVATVQVGGGSWVVSSRQRPETVTLAPSVMPIEVPGEVPGWARYVLGPLWLLQAAGVEVPPLKIEVDGDVPIGAGLASSAALVCSVATALTAAIDLELRTGLEVETDLLALTRAVENDVVGAPTGGMDQLVSLRAQEGHALFCDMRSLVSTPVPLDLAAAGLALLVVDTHAAHRHADGAYADRRSGCEEAARTLGVTALRDVSTDELEPALARLDDARLQRLTRHVVTENQRVLTTARLLRGGCVEEIGPQLSASHVSMRDDFEITVPEVDLAVETLLGAGALGARMTGGGFGGCVIGLVGINDVAEAEGAVRRAFSAAGFTSPTTFTASPAGGARILGG